MALDFLLMTVAYDNIKAQTAWCVEKSHLRGLNVFMWGINGGDALIGRTRSVAASNFLEQGPAEYMIFLDSDIVFEPEDLHRLHQNLQKGFDLIGGCYVVKDGSQLASYGWNGQVKLDGTIQEIEYLATGFMGISKKLLAKIRDELNLPLLHQNEAATKCWPFFESGARDRPEGRIYISEDWHFCDLARKVGVKSHLDTAIRLGHIGTYGWCMDDLLRVKEQKEKESPRSEMGAEKEKVT